MKFDLILTNPPFQDTVGRGRTPHKLWIEFTLRSFEEFLSESGILCQVSPSSFRSPSSKVLRLMLENDVLYLNLETDKHFPGVGSSFADYAIAKQAGSEESSPVSENGSTEFIPFDKNLLYLPNDLCLMSLSIHRKVIFEASEKLDVRWDYVTCHNIRLRRDGTLSKSRTEEHVFPVFHTNRQKWWSSQEQSWRLMKKIMWTRSGYTRPFYDDGVLGGTDMVYYVPVRTKAKGEALAANLNSKLFQYIFDTARWSGFGNERVFAALPDISGLGPLSDRDMFSLFGLTSDEQKYVLDHVG